MPVLTLQLAPIVKIFFMEWCLRARNYQKNGCVQNVAVEIVSTRTISL